MTDCRSLRATLVRVAEGDARPDEALAIARHLPDCTACRILLAREVRLEAALESLEDPVSVDDGFLGAVMSALPVAPPKRRRKRTRLTLVGGGSAIVLAVLAVAASSVRWPADPRAIGFPSLDSLPLDRIFEFAGAAVIWVRFAAEGFGRMSAFELPALRALLPTALLAFVGLAAACVGFSALLVALGSRRLRASPPRG